MKKLLTYTIPPIAVLLLVWGLWGMNDESPSVHIEPAPEADLIAEFENAYPSEITPNGNTVEIDLVAGPSSTEIIPGHETATWSYNGTTPGPEIRIQLGDSLKINFENQLDEPTTIHFHGIRVPNEMDGVPSVTQELINPGETFTYEFTPKDAGTYWFHPHFESEEQIERGLYGVIVVEDEYADLYSQDEVWVIDDWLLTQDYEIYSEFSTHHDLMHDGRWGNVVTVNSHLDETLVVRPGERIRLRLVNPSNGRVYALDFGDLEVDAIAVDGLAVREVFDAQGFELAPGNRIDLDITIPSDASGQSFTVYDTFTRNKIPLAQIKVEGEPVETPTFAFPTNSNVPEWAASGNPVDVKYVLDSGSKGMSMMSGTEWTMNGQAYPDVDSVLFEEGDFIKIQFVNDSYRLHPMHLHGQFFKVISRDGEPVDEPFFRDTVLVHPKETVEIAMIPIDSGDWVNHCHILEHAESGMMTLFSVE